MGVKGLAALIKKQLFVRPAQIVAIWQHLSYLAPHRPALIKEYPDRWRSPELRGKRVALDGSLIVNRLFFAGHADEERDPKRIIIGWHDLITKMRQAGVIPIAVWDEPGRRDWKSPEHVRRATQRSLHLSRSLHEEERSLRTAALASWVEEARALPQEEFRALGRAMAVLEETVEEVDVTIESEVSEVLSGGFQYPSSDERLTRESSDGTDDSHSIDSPSAALPTVTKEELGEAGLRTSLDDGLPTPPVTADPAIPTTPTTPEGSDTAAIPAQSPAIAQAVPTSSYAGTLEESASSPVALATRLHSLALEAEASHRPAQPRRKRDDIEVQTAIFVETIEADLAIPVVAESDQLEIEDEVLAIPPETSYTETPRQTQISEDEIELFHQIKRGTIEAAGSVNPSEPPVLDMADTKLAQIIMAASVVSKTHESGLTLPSREDHVDSQELLTAMGVPVIIAQAPYEAEGLASFMCKVDLVDYVGTEDSDVLAYGGTMLRHITEGRKSIETVSGEEVRQALGLDEETFLDFMILLGTDASDRINNVGPVKALKLLRDHGTIEQIIRVEEKVAAKIPSDFWLRTNIARGVSRSAPPLPSCEELEGYIAPESEVQAYMREKHGVIVPDQQSGSSGFDDPEADYGHDEGPVLTGWSKHSEPEKPEVMVARKRPSFKSDGLTLQHFVLRTEILKAYRGAIRTTRPLPDSATRREILDWMRSDLERLRGVIDLGTIKEHLGSFLRTQKQFGPSLGLSIAGIDDALGSARSVTAKLIGRKRQENVLTRRFIE